MASSPKPRAPQKKARWTVDHVFVKAIKTLSQDGDHYDTVGDAYRCQNCHAPATGRDIWPKHTEDCEVGILEAFLQKFPDVLTDMDVAEQKAANR